MRTIRILKNELYELMTLQRLFLYASLNERVENQMEDEDHQNAFAIIAIVPRMIYGEERISRME